MSYLIRNISDIFSKGSEHVFFERRYCKSLRLKFSGQKKFAEIIFFDTNILAKNSPKLVDGFIPDVMSLGIVVKVMQNLLNEGVSIRDLRTIVQTLLEYGPKSTDTEVLTAAVQLSLPLVWACC